MTSNDPYMTFDPITDGVTRAQPPRHHWTQVSLKSIKACVYSIPKTTGLTMLTNRVNNVKVQWPQMTPTWPLTPSLIRWHMHKLLGIIGPKFHWNPSKHVCIASQNTGLTMLTTHTHQYLQEVHCGDFFVCLHCGGILHRYMTTLWG